MPYYNLDELKTACGKTDAVYHVFLRPKAEEDARRVFKLKNKTEVWKFIANGGIDDAKFQNTEELRECNYTQKVFVDAYNFKTGAIYGYIAFYRVPNPQKESWMIKSFKESDQIPEEETYTGLDGGAMMQQAIREMRQRGGEGGHKALPDLRDR